MTLVEAPVEVIVAPATTTGNPFRGLIPYGEHDTLYARDSDIQLIQSRLWASRVTILFAGSGVGKTSFLCAKLLPTLKKTFGSQNVAMPHKWARTDPGRAIAEAREQVNEGTFSRRGSVIVLDQFEEVFQHLSRPAVLRDCGLQIAEIVQDTRSNLRILISIREEFLADLTVFDDFLPGVLTNYYRLGRLTPKQARLVIEKTARSAGRDVDAVRLTDLLNDLAAVHDAADRQPGQVVDPPYLQIACQRIWNREEARRAQAFLSSYQPGEARSQLDAYCREKLDRLSWKHRKVVRKAIEQLTGPREAKKPARLSELAAQIAESPRVLDEALGELSCDEVKILRRWPDQAVFELYHDMYAPRLWAWKGEQEGRERTWMLLQLCLMLAVLSWQLLWPAFNWSKASVILGRPDAASSTTRDAAAVLDMRNAFAHTVLSRWAGDALWRGYMRRLETLSALQQDTDAVMGYRLAALTTRASLTPEVEERALGPASHLAGAVTGLVGVTDAFLSDESVTIGTNAGSILQWTVRGGRPRETRISVPESLATAANRPDATSSFGNAPPTVLCLSPDGRWAAVAWFLAGSRPGDAPSLTVVETATGTLPKDGAARSLQSSEPLATRAVPLQTNTLQDLRAAFSFSGKRLAVLDRGRAIVFDRTLITEGWVVPIGDRTVTDLAFVSDDVLATASHPRRSFPELPGERLDDDQIDLWTYGVSSPREWPRDGRPMLPPKTWLVADGRGGFLGMVGDEWRWIAGESQARVTLPDKFLVPRAYDANREVLLSQDAIGRLIVSRGTAPGNAPQFETLAITNQRTFPIAAPRRLTLASVQQLGRRAFLTVDDNGSAVRVWRVPESLSTGHHVAAAKVAPNAGAPAIFKSADGQWTATADSTTIRVASSDRPGEGNAWTAPQLSERPANMVVSTSGTRVAVWTTTGLWYGDKRDQLLHFIAQNARDLVFGPGERRVTIVTDDAVAPHVIVYDSSSQNRQGGKWQGAWSARVQPNTFLLHSPDESSVVLFSSFWLHRLTLDDRWSSWFGNKIYQRPEQWPRVTSVFQQHEIRTVAAVPGSGNNRVSVQDCPEQVDFDAEDQRLRHLRASWRSLHWLSPRSIALCDDDAVNGGPNRTNPMCVWELRSGRRLGTPFKP